ncbi:hypothetical protein [Brachyspira sp. SAP_772]|uniref:hypothetical protein n=1 Tax=Brachyspira sp. SAP_772 TaxID=2608385 RepID=UPI0012F4F63F|nr:hypothetical protein [Brachyspira sp. SAP_772]
MKFSVLAIIIITISLIFYNEMKKHYPNKIIIEVNEKNNIYNANYIVNDKDIILENSYDFNNNVETKEIYRRYFKFRSDDNYNIDFEEVSQYLLARLIIIFMIGCAILGILIEMIFFKNGSCKYYIIVSSIIILISSIIIYKIHKNLAIFNIGGSTESILELLAFFFGGILSFIVLLISKHLRSKDNKKNNEQL